MSGTQRKGLTVRQWERAIAAEMRASMAAEKLTQKDLVGLFTSRDPGWLARRMSGDVPFSAAQFVVLCEFLGWDMTEFLARAAKWEE